MNTTYEQIIVADNIASFNNDENIPEIISLAKSEHMHEASKDNQKTLLLAIDVQNDFMENIGSLPVQGSKDDVKRLTRWIYDNLSGLTQIMCSLDCHSIRQIFHSDWWVDDKGNNPAPFTIITYQDVLDGKWMAANGQNCHSLEYLKSLEAGGKKQLCIWPYHCLEGTRGAKLESEFTKMIYFHSAARSTTPILISKGMNPYTEMYGIIKAENDEENYINQMVLDAVKEYDKIYVAGEASSHCVLASVEQILEYYADNKEMTSRLTLLVDCMSPIAGFDASTMARFQELRDKYGVSLEQSINVKL